LEKGLRHCSRFQGSGNLDLQVFQVGHALLTAVSWHNVAPIPVSKREQQSWLRHAVQAFPRAGEHGYAGRIHLVLGQYEKAKEACQKAGNRQAAAMACIYGAKAKKVLCYLHAITMWLFGIAVESTQHGLQY